MYRNILVINLMHLGDLLLTTPVLRTLRANYPKAKITLLADLKLADTVSENKYIDECMFLDKKGKDNHFAPFVRFIQRVRQKHFDLVINLHRNERASALAAFSGGKEIVGYSKPFFSLFFKKVLINKKAQMHQIHSHFEVLKEAAGVTKIDDGGLEMWLPKAAKKSAKKIWQSNFSPKDKVVAFNIGASWLGKRWLDTYFARCADDLIEHNYTVLFLGGTMDVEIVEKCIAQMEHRTSEKLRVLTGKLTLGELGGVLANCCLFITTDSGPMHVGVAMNVPIVTMFGASPVPGFYPYDAKDILIKSPAPCHPCDIQICPKRGEEHMKCMKSIPPAAVLKYAYEQLERFGGKPARELPSHYGQYECRVVELK